MRDAFVDTLVEMMRDRTDLLLVTGDLGFGIFDDLREEFGDRFFNVGVAEQTMMGLATGLAMTGNHVIAYSIANFATLRCLEQLRNDVGYHKAPVTVVAVGGGFAYGNLGMSHHATCDIAVVRAIGGLDVITPCDPDETKTLFRQTVESSRPSYFRLGRNGEPTLPSRPHPVVELGVPRVLREGGEVVLAACGPVAQEALLAAEELEKSGISTSVIAVNSITPFDCDAFALLLKKARWIFSIEEHTINGGLGSVIAEVLAERAGEIGLTRLGVPPDGDVPVGTQAYMRDVCHISAEGIVNRVLEWAG